MKKLFQIIITCVALTVLFFNHYDFVYPCLSSHEVTFERWTTDKCDKYSFFPSDVSQDSLKQYWDKQLFPDLFTILIYFMVMYFTKDSKFKFKKKETKDNLS